MLYTPSFKEVRKRNEKYIFRVFFWCLLIHLSFLKWLSSFLIVVLSIIWCFFLSTERTSCSISYKVCLLVKHYLGLWLSGNVFTLLSFVKDDFAGYRILFFIFIFLDTEFLVNRYFSTMNMSLHCFVASIVSELTHLCNFYLFIEIFKIRWIIVVILSLNFWIEFLLIT